MYTDRRHKTPGSETKDLITAKAVATASALLCQFPERRFPVAPQFV